MLLNKAQIENVKILKQIRRNLKDKKRGCMVDGCKENAINSHLLQRHGILNNIIEDGHMMELRPNDMFKWNREESPIVFKRVGLNDAISYPLFCNHHDTEIFAEIENSAPDLYSYRTRLLFSYRAICADEYKKRFEAEYFDRIINSRTLDFDHTYMCKFRDSFCAGVRDLCQFKSIILEELASPSHRMEFVHLEFPRFPVYASSPFSYETNLNKLYSSDMWDGGVIHIIPLNDKLHILWGYLKDSLNKDMEEYINKWRNVNKESLGVLLTDLFTQRIEIFGMSPSLYRSINKINVEKYFKSQLKSYQTYDMNLCVDFNMFEGDVWDNYNLL